MGTGNIARKLNKGRAKPGPAPKADATEAAKKKAISLGEAIVELNDEIESQQERAKDIQARLAETKLGQELAQLRAEIAELQGRMTELEKDAMPTIKLAEPETKRVELPSGYVLTVETKLGPTSATLTNLKKALGKKEADTLWKNLEAYRKESEYLTLEDPSA